MSLVWFFCLGGQGIFFPYYSLYLRENIGLTGTELGIVFAVLPLVGIAAQPFWGIVADRTGSRAGALALLAVGVSAGFAALGVASSFAALLLATAALAFFSTAILPACVAATLAVGRDGGEHAFGIMRVWGTVGFFAMVVGFPWLLHLWQDARGLAASPGGPSEPGLELMFPISAGFVLVGGLVALALPRGGAMSVRAPRGDWRRLLRHGPFLRILGFALLAFFCLRGPMAMFPIYVRAHGGSLDSVSHMWILMLALEIPLVALSGAGLKRLGPRGLIAIGVLAGGVRWTVCGFATDPRWIFAVQILHGVVVTGLVIGAPLYVDAVVPERLRSTGQGMLAMIGISVGGITSNLGAGILLEHFGPNAPYVVGGLGALLLFCLLPVVLPPAERIAPLAGEDAGV